MAQGTVPSQPVLVSFPPAFISQIQRERVQKALAVANFGFISIPIRPPFVAHDS